MSRSRSTNPTTTAMPRLAATTSWSRAWFAAGESGVGGGFPGRVTGGRGFGRDARVGLLLAGLADPVDDFLGVAAGVADGAVELGGRLSRRPREVGLHAPILFF